MDRISTTTKAVDLFGAGKHGFKDGNLGLGIAPTDFNAAWFNDIQEELIGIIEGAGLTPTAGTRTQVSQAIQAMIAATLAQDYKASVRAATVGANITLAGSAPNTLDGVTLATNDRILVKDQTTQSQNGIYVVTILGTGVNGTWTRATDADGVGELTSGAVVAVEEGTANADTIWMQTTDGAITIGTTSLTFARKDPGAASGQQPGEICYFARNTAPTGFLKANGAAISRSTYAALFAAIYKSATVTMTIATPGVITWNAHGLSANDPVQFTTTGVLPTGFVTATQYFVVGASITTNTFRLSATPGGAAINTTGSQSGIHTAHNAPFGIGDGSTTFNVPDLRGEFLRGWDDSRAVDANRSFGSAQAQDMQPHTHITPAVNSVSNGTGAPARSATGSDGTLTTSSAGGVETRPRNVAMLACIKY